MTGRERLLAACRGEAVDATPVWFMRQSGGSLPGYLARRERHSVMEIAKSPRLAAEVALEAADTLGTDAAVMFADIMLPIEAMGLEVELAADGPRLPRPVRSTADVTRLRSVDVSSDLGFVLDTASAIRRELGGRAALIGIAGGPFTLAAYMIEGAPSRDQLRARTLMYAAPEVWAALLERITTVISDYVRALAGAGADVIHVFDSWAGILGPGAYDRFVAPWSRRVLDSVRSTGVPAVHFAAAGAGLLERLAAGADVVGVDAAQSLAAARDRLPDHAVQGNLDAAVLTAGWPTVRAAVRAVLAENGGRAGHVFNTGHAAPRDTPPAVLRDVVELVHAETAGQVAPSGAAAMHAGSTR